MSKTDEKFLSELNHSVITEDLRFHRKIFSPYADSAQVNRSNQFEIQ